MTWLKWLFFLSFLSLLADITVPGVIVHLLCTCVILPKCDDGQIFYKDIHICMWVTVSMLKSHVLLCEHPTMTLKKLLRQVCWLLLLHYHFVHCTVEWGFYRNLFYLFSIDSFIFKSQIINNASICCGVLSSKPRQKFLRWERIHWRRVFWTTRLGQEWVSFVMFSVFQPLEMCMRCSCVFANQTDHFCIIILK